MIKLKNNTNVETGVSTLTLTREPLPVFLIGLQSESLHDLSWTDPALGVSDCAWLPEVDQSPTLNEYERYGTETLTLGNGVVIVTKTIVPWGASEIASDVLAKSLAIQKEIVSQVQLRLDTFAQSRNYDSILSASTYATSVIPKFQAEGQAAVNARDTTWATLYTILGEVQSGTRPAPESYADLEVELPQLNWPV